MSTNRLDPDQKVSGIIPLYKPKNIVSKDVTRILVRLFGRHKMGHVGTLDPFAEGVLPIVVGSYSRLQDMLLNSSKIYRCKVKLGVETDSLDCTGNVVSQASYEHVSLESLKKACLSFLGVIEQTPPLFSAVKYKGIPLYKYVREKKTALVPLDKLKRTVQVYSLRIVAFDNHFFTFEAKVSKGTYIRVLAQEIAGFVGTKGVVVELMRKQTGGISFENTYSLETIKEGAARDKSIAHYFTPLDSLDIDPVFYRLPKVEQEKILCGQYIYKSLENFLGCCSKELCFEDLIKNDTFILLKSCEDVLLGIGVVKYHPSGIMFRLFRSLL